MELTIDFESDGDKIFVCGECGKRYDNYDEWIRCCNRCKLKLSKNYLNKRQATEE